MNTLTGSTMDQVIMDEVNNNNELVYNNQSNTMVKFTPSPKTTWRNYGTKSQRKAFKKSLTTPVNHHKQTRINTGAAILLGLAASHIYADKVA